jgi:hypothetical protein
VSSAISFQVGKGNGISIFGFSHLKFEYMPELTAWIPVLSNHCFCLADVKLEITSVLHVYGLG